MHKLYMHAVGLLVLFLGEVPRHRRQRRSYGYSDSVGVTHSVIDWSARGRWPITALPAMSLLFCRYHLLLPGVSLCHFKLLCITKFQLSFISISTFIFPGYTSPNPAFLCAVVCRCTCVRMFQCFDTLASAFDRVTDEEDISWLTVISTSDSIILVVKLVSE